MPNKRTEIIFEGYRFWLEICKAPWDKEREILKVGIKLNESNKEYTWRYHDHFAWMDYLDTEGKYV